MMASEIPDIYSDMAQVFVTEWGVVLGFRATNLPLEQPPPGGSSPTTIEVTTELRGIVRMSQQHAKAFTMALRKSLKSFEARSGEIAISPSVYETLKLTSKDW